MEEIKTIGGYQLPRGADGGHYTPVITQPTADTMMVEFQPSKAGMAAVEPVEIKLPVGNGNGSGQNAALTTAQINTLAAVINAIDAFTTTNGQELIDNFNAAWGVPGGDTGGGDSGGEELPEEPDQPGGDITGDALNRDGLVFEFDFRNVTMETYNLTGWGAVKRTVDKTNTALLFGDGDAVGTDMGLGNYGFRECRLVAKETEKVRLGTMFTVQALYSDFDGAEKRLQPNLFGWCDGSNIAGSFRIGPKYLAGETVTNTTETAFKHTDGKYIAVTYVVSGNILDVYYDSAKVASYNGADYDGFTQWVDYGVPNVLWSGGVVAFVGYSRALTEREIVDNLAYFKTLEVSV